MAFDLAFDRVGMQCAWQVELNKYSRSVLERHWPDVPKYEDVRNVGGKNLESVSLICGGFPCTDISVAGKRAGLAGEQSGLWFEFHRIIGEIKPQWVVIENVDGLLSSNRGRDFAVILQGLGEFGYLSAWRILDAQYFGLAQRRRRVFIVGSLGNGRSAEVLFESESLCGGTPPSGKEEREVAKPPGSGSGKRGYRDDLDHGAYVVETRIFQSWASHTNSMNPGLVSPTLDKGKSEGLAIYQESYGGVQPRRLTPIECERLQGFPDNFTDGQANSHRYRQLGNTVAVPVVEWIGRRIIKLHNERIKNV